MSARESRRQRESRGGRKRACAPPPASGRRSRSSSGSSCRSRCSWEKRQRGRACSGRTGSLPSPSLLPPLPQTHFRSSRPCRRSSSGGSSRRRRRGVGRITHLTGPPLRAPARDAHRPPPPRAHFVVAAGREGPATGNRTRIAPLPSSLPPIRRPPSRLPSPPPPAKPRMEPPPTRRRLAPGDGFVKRPEPRRQAQPPPPPPGAPALASQNRVPEWPGPSACLHPEPWDEGHSSSLLPPPLPEPFASSGGPRSPTAFPDPGLGVARGHRPREAEAVRAYLSPVLLRRGVWRRRRWAASAVLSSPPPPPLPLAAAAAAAAAAVGVSGAAAAAAAGLFLSGYVKVT